MSERVAEPASWGFTLMELLIVVAVIAIAAQAAVPALMNMVRDNRLVSQLNGFTSSLLLARNQAAGRGMHVALCPSTDGSSCSGGQAWEVGWIVFVDGDDDRRVDEDEAVLRYQQALSGGNTVESNVSRKSIGYSPMGRASSASFWICDPRGAEKARGITLGTHGRPYVFDDSDGNGIRDYGSGDRDVICP